MLPSQVSILLIEPSPKLRQVLEQQLTLLGIVQIDSCVSGAQAKAFLQQQQPTLVISALYLADMTAVELVRQLREMPALEQQKLVISHNEARFPYAKQIEDDEAVSTLAKPFGSKTLSKLLTERVDMIAPISAAVWSGAAAAPWLRAS